MMVRLSSLRKITEKYSALKKAVVLAMPVLALTPFVLMNAPGEAIAQSQKDLGIPTDAAAMEEEMEIPQFERQRVLSPMDQEDVEMPSAGDLNEPGAKRVDQQTPPPLLPENGEAPVDEDLFYDAGDLVPSGEMARRTPRKVNPKYEPASKMIVVKKDKGAGSTQAQLVSASRAMTLGRYDAALDLYQSMYEKNPKNAAVLMGIAVALQRMGDTDAAIAAYDELLELKPNNIDAEVNMLGLLSEKYPQVALHRLTELRQDNTSHLGIAAQLAVTQAQLGNTAEAIKYLGVASSMEPQNPSHIYNMAVIADRAGKKKDAIRFYEEALEVDSIYGGGRTLQRDVIFERLAKLR